MPQGIFADWHSQVFCAQTSTVRPSLIGLKESHEKPQTTLSLLLWSTTCVYIFQSLVQEKQLYNSHFFFHHLQTVQLLFSKFWSPCFPSVTLLRHAWKRTNDNVFQWTTPPSSSSSLCKTNSTLKATIHWCTTLRDDSSKSFSKNHTEYPSMVESLSSGLSCWSSC